MILLLILCTATANPLSLLVMCERMEDMRRFQLDERVGNPYVAQVTSG